MNLLKNITTPNLHTPYCFEHVTIQGTSDTFGKVAFSLLDNVYSEFASGPNLWHVANIGALFFGAGSYTFTSCKPVGFQCAEWIKGVK